MNNLAFFWNVDKSWAQMHVPHKHDPFRQQNLEAIERALKKISL